MRVQRVRVALGRTSLGALLLGLWLSPAEAQPTVRVQAASRVDLLGIEGGRLRGKLVDDLQRPLGDRIVLVRWRAADETADRRASARTDRDGQFELDVGVTSAVVHVSATYAGDPLLAPGLREGTFDARLAPVSLRLIAPEGGRVDLDADTWVLAVEAASSGARGGADVTVTLRDQRGATLAAGNTADDGVLRATLPTQAFARAGAERIFLTSAADAQRGASAFEQLLIGYLRTRVSLKATQRGEQLRAEGRVVSRRGPVVHKPVGLFVNRAHLATVVSDEHGHYRHLVDRDALRRDGAGTVYLQARFDSDSAWLGSSRSTALALALPPPAGANAAWLLLPTALCALLALAWSRTRARQSAALDVHDARGPGIYAVGPRTKGRSESFLVGGVVLDAHTSRPIDAAEVRLERATAETVSARCDDRGRFSLTAAVRGEHRVTFHAPGYDSLAEDVRLPHHGSWAHVQVLLPSLRWAALQAYKPAALRVLVSPELWGRLTVREVRERAARTGRDSASLARAAELTERAAYEREPPSAALVADIAEASSEDATTALRTPSK